MVSSGIGRSRFSTAEAEIPATWRRGAGGGGEGGEAHRLFSAAGPASALYVRLEARRREKAAAAAARSPATSPQRAPPLRFVPVTPSPRSRERRRRRVHSPPRNCRPLAKQRTGRSPLRARASLSRSSSYLSAPLPAAPLRPSRPRRPRRAREQEAWSLAPMDEPFAREAASGAFPSSRTCLALSLLQLHLRAARRSSAPSPPSYSSKQSAGGAEVAFARPTEVQLAREAATVPSSFTHHPSPSLSTSSLSEPLAAAPLRTRRPHTCSLKRGIEY